MTDALTESMTKALTETFTAGARSALDALAEGFEELARADLDGDHGTVTYRDLIDVIRKSRARIES